MKACVLVMYSETVKFKKCNMHINCLGLACKDEVKRRNLQVCLIVRLVDLFNLA